jgi:hypothetical protein
MLTELRKRLWRHFTAGAILEQSSRSTKCRFQKNADYFLIRDCQGIAGEETVVYRRNGSVAGAAWVGPGS